IFDDGDALAVEFRQNAAQQGGLARAQETGEHGDRDQGVGGWSSIHDGLECDATFPPLCWLRRVPVDVTVPAAGRVRRSACDYIIGSGFGQTRDPELISACCLCPSIPCPWAFCPCGPWRPDASCLPWPSAPARCSFCPCPSCPCPSGPCAWLARPSGFCPCPCDLAGPSGRRRRPGRLPVRGMRRVLRWRTGFS